MNGSRGTTFPAGDEYGQTCSRSGHVTFQRLGAASDVCQPGDLVFLPNDANTSARHVGVGFSQVRLGLPDT